MDRPDFAALKRLMLAEVKKEAQSECCVLLQKLPTRRLLAMVPCGPVCDDSAAVVGQTCRMYREELREAIRVLGIGCGHDGKYMV